MNFLHCPRIARIPLPEAQVLVLLYLELHLLVLLPLHHLEDVLSLFYGFLQFCPLELELVVLDLQGINLLAHALLLLGEYLDPLLGCVSKLLLLGNQVVLFGLKKLEF